jgi:threonine dehydratase
MEPDSQTFDIVRDLVDQVVRTDEAFIVQAMRDLVRHEHLITEGAGATGVAALLSGQLNLSGRRVGVMLTGRNVDVSTLSWQA